MSRFFISAIVAAMACGAALAEEPDWALSLPGWKYQFPRDHFAHPDFKTEWWYFTGNLTAEDGEELGFQLTFFRQGVRRGEGAETRFAVEDIKLAHFAVTDISGGKFRFAQRVSRGAFGEAGFSGGDRIAWIDDWTLRLTGPGRFRLEAKDKDFALALDLTAAKDPVFHGENGGSQKAAGEGRASHYYSYTRLGAVGTVTLSGREIPVTGWSSTHTRPLVGWSSPATSRSRVDLPHPLGPNNATISPGARSSDTLASTSMRWRPRPNDFDTARNCTGAGARRASSCDDGVMLMESSWSWRGVTGRRGR